LQVFSRYLQPGGEANSVARMARDWAAAGHEVVRFWKATADWLQPGGPSRLAQVRLLWYNAAVLHELRQLHNRVRPDAWIVHNVLPVISLGVFRLARELRVPLFLWLHNCRPVSVSGTLMAGRSPLRPSDPWRHVKEILAGTWNGPLATAWLTLGYTLARWRGDFDAVTRAVAVSEATAKVFREAGWFADRLEVLRHAWTPEQPAREWPDEGYFLFLGRLVDSKGIRFLVRLWRRPELAGCRLVVAGDGPEAEPLRAGSPPNIQWVGHVTGEAKQRWLQGCRAVLFPCLAHEALTTGVYEAYEYLKPVLASRIGGMPEIVHPGQTGWLLEPGAEPAWLQAVLETTPQEARRRGRAGRQWLETHASTDRWNREFDALLARALPPRPA
jgi:glycosyltransferase involved in cell wall biosynthesis